MTDSTAGPVTATYPIGKIVVAYLIAVALSIVASFIIRWVGMLFVIPPADLTPFYSWSPIVSSLFVYIGVATLIWAFIARRSRTPLSTWNKVVVIGLVLSFIPSVAAMLGPQPSFAGTFTWPAMAILLVMHVASAIITWWALPRFSHA